MPAPAIPSHPADQPPAAEVPYARIAGPTARQAPLAATLLRAPAAALKGRGTVWALEHRFQAEDRTSFNDGWGTLEQLAAEEAGAPETQVIESQVQGILSRNDSPDIGFDLSINPYRGCEHEMWNSSGGLGKGE